VGLNHFSVFTNYPITIYRSYDIRYIDGVGLKLLRAARTDNLFHQGILSLFPAPSLIFQGEPLLDFLERRKAKKELLKNGITPLDDVDNEYIKDDLNDLINSSGTYFASLGIAVSFHYDALDEKTREELLDDSVYYVNQLNKMVQRSGNDHYGFSLLYALLYYSYCSNTTLCTSESWNDYFNGIKTTIELMLNEQNKKPNSMSGYA